MRWSDTDDMRLIIDIPDNATNGEIIQTLFSDFSIRKSKGGDVLVSAPEAIGECYGSILVRGDWWHKLYKRVK